MVRVNLLDPRRLADQHLIAEYDEILMLLGYVKRYPRVTSMPAEYTLGKGHMIFFKDKLAYLKKRHESIKKEMKRRGFTARKTINLAEFPAGLRGDWKPCERDKKIIRARLVWKIKKKPKFYRYCGEKKTQSFLIGLLNR